MTALETKLKEQGLFFSFSKLFILALGVTLSLKFLELQFVEIPNFYESTLAVFIRSLIFICSTWSFLHALLLNSDKLPKRWFHFVKNIYLSRDENFEFIHFIKRLFTSFLLTLPIYFLTYFLLEFLISLEQFDHFAFTINRALTFYFLFMPFLITVLDLKIQFQVARFLNNERLERERRIKEKDAQLFKAKLKPHFLFNTLNSIASLIRFSPKDAEVLVENLSDFFRSSLELSDKEFISIKEEINIIKNVLKIEKTRFGDRLNFSFLVSKNIEELEIPSLLIQPFVENTIKHGVEKSVNPVQISVEIKELNSMLDISISDNGSGCDLNSINFGHGIKTSFDRIKHYYGSTVIPKITTSPKNGFSVSLTIPIEKKL